MGNANSPNHPILPTYMLYDLSVKHSMSKHVTLHNLTRIFIPYCLILLNIMYYYVQLKTYLVSVCKYHLQLEGKTCVVYMHLHLNIIYCMYNYYVNVTDIIRLIMMLSHDHFSTNHA